MPRPWDSASPRDLVLMNAPTLHVGLLPALVHPDEVPEALVVVIDVLRASTTMIEALAHGAREVITRGDVESALRQAAKFPRGQVVLGGERGGVAPAGFDLGNSPSEYTPQAVAGRSVVFTTTNGTAALERARTAGRVVVGGFVNLSACVAELASADKTLLMCAGTDGAITREDVLLAGAVAHRLCSGGRRWQLSDAARLAQAAWLGTGLESIVRQDPASAVVRLAAELADSQGGRNLAALGLERDLSTAAHLDRWSLVPGWNADDSTLRLA